MTTLKDYFDESKLFQESAIKSIAERDKRIKDLEAQLDAALRREGEAMHVDIADIDDRQAQADRLSTAVEQAREWAMAHNNLEYEFDTSGSALSAIEKDIVGQLLSETEIAGALTPESDINPHAELLTALTEVGEKEYIELASEGDINSYKALEIRNGLYIGEVTAKHLYDESLKNEGDIPLFAEVDGRTVRFLVKDVTDITPSVGLGVFSEFSENLPGMTTESIDEGGIVVIDEVEQYQPPTEAAKAALADFKSRFSVHEATVFVSLPRDEEVSSEKEQHSEETTEDSNVKEESTDESPDEPTRDVKPPAKAKRSTKSSS